MRHIFAALCRSSIKAMKAARISARLILNCLAWTLCYIYIYCIKCYLIVCVYICIIMYNYVYTRILIVFVRIWHLSIRWVWNCLKIMNIMNACLEGSRTKSAQSHCAATDALSHPDAGAALETSRKMMTFSTCKRTEKQTMISRTWSSGVVFETRFPIRDACPFRVISSIRLGTQFSASWRACRSWTSSASRFCTWE